VKKCLDNERLTKGIIKCTGGIVLERGTLGGGGGKKVRGLGGTALHYAFAGYMRGKGQRWKLQPDTRLFNLKGAHGSRSDPSGCRKPEKNQLEGGWRVHADRTVLAAGRQKERNKSDADQSGPPTMDQEGKEKKFSRRMSMVVGSVSRIKVLRPSIEENKVFRNAKP